MRVQHRPISILKFTHKVCPCYLLSQYNYLITTSGVHIELKFWNNKLHSFNILFPHRSLYDFMPPY